MKKKKRDWWLTYMMKTFMKDQSEILGCEVGTGGGNAMKNVLPANPKLKLIEVAWYPKSNIEQYTKSNYNSNKARQTWEKVIEPYLDRIIILNMPSNQAVNHVDDGSLDWVFIDADHMYESVKEDIKIWYPKVRPGGLVCGHDYNPGLERLQGVIKAVDEYFGKNFEVYKPDHVWYHWKRL